jgi:hypothetical protein
MARQAWRREDLLAPVAGGAEERGRQFVRSMALLFFEVPPSRNASRTDLVLEEIEIARREPLEEHAVGTRTHAGSLAAATVQRSPESGDLPAEPIESGSAERLRGESTATAHGAAASRAR